MSFKKLFNSKVFLFVVIIPIMICAIIAICLFLLWLMEKLFEYNSIIGLISLLIAGHIGGYFFLYRKSRTWIKIFLWLFLILEVIGSIYIFNLFNS